MTCLHPVHPSFVSIFERTAHGRPAIRTEGLGRAAEPADSVVSTVANSEATKLAKLPEALGRGERLLLKV